VLLLELVIVFVDLRPEFDFLDLDHLLVLFGLARALLLLVLIFPEIHDPADRRAGRWGDLDEVEPFLLGDGDGLRRRHDAELLAGVVDHADFPHADSFVDPDAIVAAGTSVESYNDLLLPISSFACATKSPTGCPPWSPPARVRTETVPSALSRSPTTSM
jgi:hypothetical protein